MFIKAEKLCSEMCVYIQMGDTHMGDHMGSRLVCARQTPCATALAPEMCTFCKELVHCVAWLVKSYVKDVGKRFDV